MTPLLPVTANVYGPYRYATAERFAAPQLVMNLEPVEEAICPQNPSPFDKFMGSMENVTQSEDCLQLKVFAKPFPPLPSGKRWDSSLYSPVMVFIHGGGFDTGGGVLDWYDGRRLADQGAVVVSINYRLGALGFLATEGGDTLNGHRDWLTALEWVKEHASDFGGDPDRVIVFGQGSGALAIAGLYRDPESQPLYSAGIMQSGPLPLITNRTVEEIQGIAANFTKFLDKDPRTATVNEILEAQDATKNVTQGLTFFPLLNGPVQAHGPLIAGWNEDDAAGFGVPLENATQATENTFKPATAAFRGELSEAGCESASYVFSVDPGPWDSAHLTDLPYILGTAESWIGSAMLNQTTWAEVDKKGFPIRKAWTDFATYRDLGKVKAESPDYLKWLD